MRTKTKCIDIDDLDDLPAAIAEIEKAEDCLIKAISFDIDGTLMNVEVISMVLAEAAVEVLEEKGCSIRGSSNTTGAYERVKELVG